MLYECEGSACKILVGKGEGKRTVERTKRRWEDNVTMDLTEVGKGDMVCGFFWTGTSGGLL
jgi:hypothetical protein